MLPENFPTLIAVRPALVEKGPDGLPKAYYIPVHDGIWIRLTIAEGTTPLEPRLEISTTDQPPPDLMTLDSLLLSDYAEIESLYLVLASGGYRLEPTSSWIGKWAECCIVSIPHIRILLAPCSCPSMKGFYNKGLISLSQKQWVVIAPNGELIPYRHCPFCGKVLLIIWEAIRSEV